MQKRRWQYPALSQPQPDIPRFDSWWQPASIPAWKPPEIGAHHIASGLAPIGEPIGIGEDQPFNQHPDPVRRPPELVHEEYATWLFELSEIKYDWHVQHPDPTRRPPELVQEGEYTTWLFELLDIPIDWLVQEFNPVLLPPRAPAIGEVVFVENFITPPPIIDFIVQHPDPLLPSPLEAHHISSGNTLVEPLGKIPAFGLPSVMAWAGRIIQYQALFQSLAPEVPVPDFGWFIQQTDQFRRPGLTPEAYTTWLLELSDIKVDWLIQEPDPVLLPKSLTPGESFFVEPYLQTDTDFIVQHPDPVRRPVQLVPEGEFTTWLLEPSEIDIDWLVQHPDPLPLPYIQQPEPQATIYDEASQVFLDKWFRQHPDPLPKPFMQPPDPLHLTPELVLPPEPIFPDKWMPHPPDPILPVPPRQDFYAFIEFQEPIFADKWQVQEPDVFQGPPTQQPDSFIFEPNVIPDIDWFIQQPDPIQEIPQPQTLPSVPEFVEVVEQVLLDKWFQQAQEIHRLPPTQQPDSETLVEFGTASVDWIQEHPGPIQELRRPEGMLAEPEFVEPITTWLQEQYNPHPRVNHVYRYPFEAERDITIPVPSMDTWWREADNPVLSLPPRQGWYELPLLEISARLPYAVAVRLYSGTLTTKRKSGTLSVRQDSGQLNVKVKQD